MVLPSHGSFFAVEVFYCKNAEGGHRWDESDKNSTFFKKEGSGSKEL